jgi:hypothetical protein
MRMRYTLRFEFPDATDPVDRDALASRMERIAALVREGGEGGMGATSWRLTAEKDHEWPALGEWPSIGFQS